MFEEPVILNTCNNSILHVFTRYLDTFPKNDVISFSRKGFCALGLELGFRIRVEVRVKVSGNTFSVKRPFGQMH